MPFAFKFRFSFDICKFLVYLELLRMLGNA
jgi:hypothetical protein